MRRYGVGIPLFYYVFTFAVLYNDVCFLNTSCLSSDTTNFKQISKIYTEVSLEYIKSLVDIPMKFMKNERVGTWFEENST